LGFTCHCNFSFVPMSWSNNDHFYCTGVCYWHLALLASATLSRQLFRSVLKWARLQPNHRHGQATSRSSVRWSPSPEIFPGGVLWRLQKGKAADIIVTAAAPKTNAATNLKAIGMDVLGISPARDCLSFCAHVNQDVSWTKRIRFGQCVGVEAGPVQDGDDRLCRTCPVPCPRRRSPAVSEQADFIGWG